MPTVITVEQHSPTNSSSRSNSFTDETSSTGTGVHVSPTAGSQEDSDDTWEGISYSDDFEPSEPASRPQTSQQYRASSRLPQSHRAPTRRHTTAEFPTHRPHIRHVHRPPPIAPSSVEALEEYPGYGRGYPPPSSQHLGGGRAPQPAYAQSYASAYPSNPFSRDAGQVIPFGGPGPFQCQQNPFSPAAAPGGPGYFPQQLPSHGTATYGGHEMMPYSQATNFGFQGAYGAPPGAFYPQYIVPSPKVPSPKIQSPKVPSPEVPVPDPEMVKKLADLQKQLEESKLDSEKSKKEIADKEAAEKKAAEQAAIKAETEKRIAEEIAKVKLEMEAKAKEDAEKAKAAAEAKIKEDAEKAKAEEEAKAKTEAEIKAKVDAELKAKAEADAKALADAKAEEEAKAKTEAEIKAKVDAEFKAKAEADAKALAEAKPTDEKKKPIKFKDAVGRKFSFPFHLCQTWAGMEELIKQAFLHVEVIGPHVADGHYDLVGPNGEIILPQVWDTMIEPDWAITMHMWPMPEPPKPEETPQIVEVGPRHPRPSAARGRHRPNHVTPGRRDRNGAPPVPPAWQGPASARGDVAAGIILMEDPPRRPKKKTEKSSGSVLGGLFGTSKPKSSGKKSKK